MLSKTQVTKVPKIQRFIKNRNGKKVAVILSMRDYRKLLDELEELSSIRAYDAAKASSDEIIPFEQAISEITARKSR